MNVSQLQFENGKMIQASKFGKEDTSQTKLELTQEEETMIKNLKVSKGQSEKKRQLLLEFSPFEDIVSQ